MILLLHNRYRTLGGEERVVEDLARLLPQELGEEVRVLERSSSETGRAAAAAGMLRGGLRPDEVAAAVRDGGARVVHAHNVHPQLGPRALEAARAAGARTVLHLHQYRLVCAVGTCLDPEGLDCTRCHGRDTRPGLRLGCRGSRVESAVYAAALAAWSGRLVAAADALVAPSAFTVARLRELGAPLDGREVHVVANPVATPELMAAPASGKYAICSGRMAPDKGVDVAIEACARAGVPLVLTGDGPDEGALRTQAGRLGSEVRFAGRVSDAELAELRAGAALAIVPVALRRDLRALVRGGDGGRAAGRRDERRRAARPAARGRPGCAGRRGRARRARPAAVGRRGQRRAQRSLHRRARRAA